MSITGLTIDTTAKPIHKTALTAAQIKQLLQQIHAVDPDDDAQTQYTHIQDVVAQMDGQFENMYDAMEIDMLKMTLDAVLNRKKRGSKPHELINVVTKILERVSATSGGRRRPRAKVNTRRSRKPRVQQLK